MVTVLPLNILQPTFKCSDFIYIKYMSMGPHQHLQPIFKHGDLFVLKHTRVVPHNLLQWTLKSDDLIVLKNYVGVCPTTNYNQHLGMATFHT